MMSKFEFKILQYSGIILGAIYGLIFRLLCENTGNEFFIPSIYSISFLWILPIVISVFPFLLATDKVLNSNSRLIIYPQLSVFLFFTLSISTKLEDIICILIISIPYLIIAGIVGLLFGSFVREKRKSKKLFSILLLPFIFTPIESYFPNQVANFEVKSTVIIATSPQTVWDNLIEVPEITDEEYTPGFFNYIGVPRPIKSVLKEVDGIEYRIGIFSEGLQLYETIREVKPLQSVVFDIHIDKSELRDLPTDQHLLKSNNFHFESISYQMKPLGDRKTELTLICNYELDSKLNGYANFWAEKIIKDFEERLLNSLRLKLEKTNPIYAKN